VGAARPASSVFQLAYTVRFNGANQTSDWGTALCCEYRLMPISIDDVEILPGDFLFGDIDGMQEIPMGVVEEVLAKAEELSGKGKLMRKGLGKGQKIRYLFEKTKAF